MPCASPSRDRRRHQLRDLLLDRGAPPSAARSFIAARSSAVKPSGPVFAFFVGILDGPFLLVRRPRAGDLTSTLGPTAPGAFSIPDRSAGRTDVHLTAPGRLVEREGRRHPGRVHVRMAPAPGHRGRRNAGQPKQVFVMRDGLICERRAWVAPLGEDGGR